MSRRLIGYIILANLLVSAIIPINLLADEVPWWDDEWDFREEIVVPINTSLDYAKYQPIDITINFSKPCWAISENKHSIRVIFQDESKFIQLESQIYDLHHIDNEHIDECNLVFLIPEQANGNEKYFIYYDDESKPDPNYEKRVEISETSYHYSPIPGITFSSDLYKITQGDQIVYGISKEGETLGEKISQQISLIKKGETEIKANSGEHAASLNFVYFWMKDGEWVSDPLQTAEKVIRADILVNGNLMVKFGIVSQTEDGKIQSTIIYKYYYCPIEDKRIYFHTRHEILDYPLPEGEEIDVSYMILPIGKITSSSIDELNFGEIPPYLHFNSEDERIRSHKLNPNPDSEEWEEVIGEKDDYDLGSIPWISADYGESGIAYSIIFETDKVLKSGSDERDGIQLLSYESKFINLPGLIARTNYLYLMRDEYEKGEPVDRELPENYVVEFNAEYFTSRNGGYPAVAKEAELYQKLISFQPEVDDEIDDDDEEVEKYTLTAFVHFAPSFPLGSVFSALLGFNFSYVQAELYKEQNQVSSGSVGRIPINLVDLDFEGKTFSEKLKTIINLFDWKNASLFKKIIFGDQPEGKYLIKIFLENPFLRNERKFIGYKIIDLKENTKTRILCKPEGKINVFLNPNNGGVEGAEISLIKDNIPIVKSKSASDGKTTLKAPCGLSENYILNVIYKGFLIAEEEIRLGRIRKYLPLKKTFNFDVHDLIINVKDSDGKTPSFDVDLSLTSDGMQYPTTINADIINDGTYTFKALYPENYDLKIKYNSFEIKEKIQIPDVNSMDINLYDFTALIKDNWDLSPEVFLDVTLTSKDFAKNVVKLGEKISPERYYFSNLYPGTYTLEVGYKSVTAKDSINIPYENNEKLIVFPAEFNTTIEVFDIRGIPLKDVKVVISRDGKEINGITNDNGKVIFSIPPGMYHSKYYHNGEFIAKRNVEILSEKTIPVATKNEPIFPMIVISITIIFLIGTGFISYRKYNLVFLLKILAIGLAIIAIISPWWGISGSSSTPHFETNTKLYLVPTEMVTIVANNNVTAGEISSLDETFTSVINLFPITITISILFIIASIFLNKCNKGKSSFFTLLISIIFIVGSNIVFFYAMSQLADVTVGSIIGSGNIDFSIPGEKTSEILSSTWGPDIGFYLLLGSAVILMLGFYLYLKNMKSNKNK